MQPQSNHFQLFPSQLMATIHTLITPGLLFPAISVGARLIRMIPHPLLYDLEVCDSRCLLFNLPLFFFRLLAYAQLFPSEPMPTTATLISPVRLYPAVPIGTGLIYFWIAFSMIWGSANGGACRIIFCTVSSVLIHLPVAFLLHLSILAFRSALHGTKIR
jgi:hypothetical protein